MRGKVAKELRRIAKEIAPENAPQRRLLGRDGHSKKKRLYTVAVNDPASIRGIYRHLKIVGLTYARQATNNR